MTATERLKRCSNCAKKKPLRDFHLRAATKADGRAYICRECKNAAERTRPRPYRPEDYIRHSEMRKACNRRYNHQTGSLPGDIGGHKSGRNRPWDSWEDAKVLDSSATAAELGEELDRSAVAVFHRRSRLRKLQHTTDPNCAEPMASQAARENLQTGNAGKGTDHA